MAHDRLRPGCGWPVSPDVRPSNRPSGLPRVALTFYPDVVDYASDTEKHKAR